MKSRVIFYHAGCPVCVDAETMVANALDPTRYEVENIHLAEKPDRITEAESAGVRSVPAIVMNEQVFHINFGASMNDVKGLT